MKFDRIENKKIIAEIEVLNTHIATFEDLIKNIENLEAESENKISESLHEKIIDAYREQVEILENAKRSRLAIL